MLMVKLDMKLIGTSLKLYFDNESLLPVGNQHLGHFLDTKTQLAAYWPTRFNELPISQVQILELGLTEFGI